MDQIDDKVEENKNFIFEQWLSETEKRLISHNYQLTKPFTFVNFKTALKGA